MIPNLENNSEVVFENLNLSDYTIHNSSNNFLNDLSSQIITDVNLPAKSISEIKAISTKKINVTFNNSDSAKEYISKHKSLFTKFFK